MLALYHSLEELEPSFCGVWRGLRAPTILECPSEVDGLNQFIIQSNLIHFDRSSAMSASRLRTVAKLAAEGVSKGAFSYSAHTSPYEKTIQNLKINEHSRVIYQGTIQSSTASVNEAS